MYEGKQASDYISEDANISWEGVNGHVKGTIKYNDTAFSGAVFISAPATQSGNFFPITLDSSCEGKLVTVKRTSTSAAEKSERQTNWLLGLPDGTATTYTITCEDKTVAKLDFAEATLLPNAAEIISAIPQEHELGTLAKAVKYLQSEDTTVEPNGNVTGTLKYVPYWKEFSSNTAQQKGHYIALRLSEDYKTKAMTVTGKSTKTATDEDWVLIVENNDSTFKFETEGKELFTLNFKNAVFEERKTGENAISAPHGDEDLGIVTKASDIVEDNYAITWEGNVGTLNGHVKWHEFSDSHFASNKTGRYVPLIVNGYDGYKLTVSGLEETEYEMEGNKIVIRIDNVGSKTATISCEGGDEIASIKFGGLMMEKPMGSQVLTILDNGDSVEGKNVADYCKNDLAISWDGNVGNVTGTFIKKDETLQKYLFPVKLNAFYNSSNTTIYKTTIGADNKAMIPVAGTTATIMIKHESTTVVATLKFTGATFSEG